jgi:pimeloyl-ACP methyl ester carboxylesterase
VSVIAETRVPADMPSIPGLDVEHRWVGAGGLRMHVAEAGSGEPLVMVHGWPQHWFMWHKVMPALAERYRLIVPDLRGFGWTDAPGHGYDKETLAADLVRLLDALELDRVRLMGHDWGGWAGFLLCLRHPERVERYVALNIPPPMSKIPRRELLGMWRLAYQVPLALPGIGSFGLTHAPQLLKGGLKRAAIDPETFTDTALDSYAAKLQEPERAAASAQVYRSFLTQDAVSVLRGRYSSIRLSTPTLLIFGTEDVVISRRMIDREHENADDLRVLLVEDCGHFVAEEQPGIVVQGALEFLS